MVKFRFLEHTADAKFQAYGKNIEEAFSNAALAMFSVITDIKKINKKEVKIAMGSGFAATAQENDIINRYDSLNKLHIKVPIVIESADFSKTKVREMKKMLKELFYGIDNLIFKNKKVRSGKGKSRGRKYKSNAGLLLVKGKDEKIKMKEIDIKSVSDVLISDLYPLGRLTVYTEKSLAELNRFSGGAKI